MNTPCFNEENAPTRNEIPMRIFGKFSIRLLGFFGPVIVYFVTPVVGANGVSTITITAALLMIYITLRMIILSSKEQLDIFMMCNYLFYYVSSGVAVIAMERQGIRLNLDWAFPLNNGHTLRLWLGTQVNLVI